MRTCTHCKQLLPDDSFELRPSGNRRPICRHCHYVLHVKAGVYRWRERQRAEALYGGLFNLR